MSPARNPFVRYIRDVKATVVFYQKHPGFRLHYGSVRA
jgi:catechol 2,3-dioxygenase-like lactoylglutathione lyase family enzyme